MPDWHYTAAGVEAESMPTRSGDGGFHGMRTVAASRFCCQRWQFQRVDMYWQLAFDPSTRCTDGCVQGVKQLAFVQRLAQVSRCAPAHAVLAQTRLIMRGNDHYGEVGSGAV